MSMSANETAMKKGAPRNEWAVLERAYAMRLRAIPQEAVTPPLACFEHATGAFPQADPDKPFPLAEAAHDDIVAILEKGSRFAAG